ncbi:hypothetical protein [Afipia felis]|uniref:Secreted protein n=2 Tax=Afipia felis TaxID=1035 RepID=A0A380W9Y3_AFIFE|nr:hypothetical protein [Afipia felis]EKS28695.1 hypothetical protein HMPREF9697_01223 [Afipia felis ATCC 53690]SUU77402.1 Uncharacterised protein [Afipia felis]SUU85469.1 Uncharacterised protein [Afipia felis]
MRIMVFVSFVLAALANLSPCFARGGAPNLMDSPGYQRRLQESRQQLQTQPAPAQPVVHHKKKLKPHN